MLPVNLRLSNSLPPDLEGSMKISRKRKPNKYLLSINPYGGAKFSKQEPNSESSTPMKNQFTSMNQENGN
jgi:hypothetical protein